MNGDALELMQELGRIHADLKQDIGAVKTEIATDIGVVKTEMAGFKGSFDTRLKVVETDLKDQKFWGNVKSASGPVMVLLHVAAHKLGFKF